MGENEYKSNSFESGKTNDKSRTVVSKGERSFWLKLGAGLFITMSLISAIGAALSSDYAQDPFHLVWYVAAGLWVTGVVTAIVMRIAGYREIAAGMALGLLIGFCALTASCIANMATYRGSLP